MSEDKPLHVRVAEALGQPSCVCEPGGILRVRFDGNTGACMACGKNAAPRYDTDWLATGHEIEKRKLYIYFDNGQWCAQPFDHDGERPYMFFGPTPLIAVCHLLLALPGAGKREVEASWASWDPATHNRKRAEAAEAETERLRAALSNLFVSISCTWRLDEQEAGDFYDMQTEALARADAALRLGKAETP